jgi:hypothetical protein
MSVRMICIGRLRGQYHTHEHENGREDIAHPSSVSASVCEVRFVGMGGKQADQ